ncbi:LysM peptidoglycan-binding domain-containing protein [Actinomycetospora soli]|uniref:LysM peptidoglycan-binding domain-containing protein n=1 Tax=Actinomycetospora soli TaxID=2893887 RepID=UPI001E4AAEE8|nr:LysM peptidoglycan-binding domain-containing protein [Actinomycetospora soli]MCD2188959.1 LysM peptidoglycan-binding domain-containing protein [Actinomycetospora soli]
MSLGRVVGILVLALVLYAIVSQPLTSAATVRNGGDALQEAGTSLIQFVRGVAPGGGSGSSSGSSSSASSSGTYTVRPGDTLSSIAARYSVSPATLADRNDLADADLIRPGQRLSVR